MGRCRTRWGAVLVAGGLALGAVAWPSTAAAEELTRFRDPRITESSGVVVVGDWLVTTNDSGDVGQVFTVDRATGQTVGVTTWSNAPVDVEALAPAGPTSVWVGDIGDNAASRATITVTRVPIGAGNRTSRNLSFRLVYPTGPRDAESLLSDPATGRLYVASKELPVGRLYAAPERLQSALPNVLTNTAQAPTLATDGAFFPSGDHLVLRKYGTAVVYTFPGMRRVGSAFDLPPQVQGEGVAVTPDNQLVLTSEGSQSPVQIIALPAEIAEAVGPAVETPAVDATESPSETATGANGSAASSDPAGESSGDPGPGGLPIWAWAAGAGVVVVGALLALLARARRPGRPEAGL